jgi:hypothetical protein
MDLVILWFAVILVRNLFQDLMWLMRGEDPPSFRRQQERLRLRAERGGPITDRYEARRYWANAWHDAWESASERRQRRHEQRRQDRRERWAREDEERRSGSATEPAEPEKDAKPDVAPMDVADPLKPVRRTPTEPGDRQSAPESADVPAEGAYRDVTDKVYRLEGEPHERAAAIERRRIWQAVKEHEANYRRYAMRRRNSGKPPTAQQLADDLGIDLAEAEDLQARWDDRYRRDQPLWEQMAEEDEDRRLRRESLVWNFGAAVVDDFDPYHRDDQIDPEVARSHFVTWFDELHKKKDLSPERREAELAEGRRLARAAGITDMKQAAQVLAGDSADRITRDMAAEVLKSGDDEQPPTDHMNDAAGTSSTAENGQAPEDATRQVLDEAALKRRFAREYEKAAAAEATGHWTRADLSRQAAEEAAIKLGINTEEEMKQVLAAYGSTSPKTRPATTSAPTITAVSINERENDMSASGETTGLGSALAYTSSMAQSAGEGAASVETSIASLQSGDVGGEALTQLAQAQEHLAQAQAAFNAANAALARHQTVQDAYSANPDAGNKQFMQND